MADRYSDRPPQLGSGMANAGNLQPAGAPPLRLDMVNKRFESMIAQLNSSAERLMNVADRLTGSSPRPVNEDSEKSNVTSVAARLERSTDDMAGLIDRINGELGRLETL